MSTHRAHGHRDPGTSADRSDSTPRSISTLSGASKYTGAAPGRRRATPLPRRSGGLSLSSMLGGAALLVAAVGAATAGQAISSTSSAPTPAPTPAAKHERHTGAYVASLSSSTLAGRDATRVSRSVVRPNLAATGADSTTQSEAEKRAQARTDLLRSAASAAETYAKELASDEWVLPTSNYRISVWFGEAGSYWSSGYHTGIDFATGYGTPVVAVTNAIVVQTGWDGAYGNQVRLQLENGDQVWYNHLSAIEVTVGQPVVKGQPVGRVGDTGNSFGYHLHLEYRLASDLHSGVDPLPVLVEHGLAL